MDTQQLINLVTGTLFLISILIIVLVIISKFGSKFFDNDYKTNNILIFITTFLFILVLIAHLFKEQPWTADTLKIIIGALIGSGSSSLAKTKKPSNQNNFSAGDITDSSIYNILGKLTQNIEQFKTDTSSINSAIINQYSEIKQMLDSNLSSIKIDPQETISLRLKTTDEFLLNKLNDIKNRNEDNWSKKWIDECLKSPSFKSQIKDKILEIESQNKKVISLNFDNIPEGIHVNLIVSKFFEID
jgi:hypothetical protein